MSNFWASRLTGTVQEQDRSLPTGYMPSPYYTPPQPPVTAPPTVDAQTLPRPAVEPAESPTKALSARSTATCPECGSGDFFQPHGQPNMMPQCYACGWNPRFAHSTAGAGLPGGDAGGPVTPARQRGEGSGAGGHSNFHSGSDGNVIAHL